MRACHGWRRPGSALCIPTPCLPPGTFAFLSWQLSGAVGTAKSARNGYSCSHTWNVVVGEAVSWCAEHNSCLLHFKFWLRLMTRNSLGFWMWPLGLDTEAGVIKKPRAQSPEILISVCRPVSLAETLWPPVAPPGWKKLSYWAFCPELNILVWQFYTSTLGLSEGSTCDGDTFSTPSVPALAN